MHARPPIGIRLKLAGAFAIVSLVIAGFTAAALMAQADIARRAAVVESRNLAFSIAHIGIENAIDDPAFLQRYVDGLNMRYGRDIAIVDTHQLGIADADSSEVGALYTGDLNDEVGQTIRDGQVRTFTETNDRHPLGAQQIVVPLRGNPAKPDSPIVGAVVLEYTPIYRELLFSQRKHLYIILTIGVLSVLFSAVFGLRVAARFAQPLVDLKRGVSAVAAGDYEMSVDARSDDEIGSLGTAFNKMAADLKDKRARLLAYQHELEERITLAKATNTRLETEIRERESSERSLRDSEARYRQLVDLSPDAICIQVQGRITFVNSACITLFGAATASDLIDLRMLDLVDPEYRQVAEERARQIRDTKLPTPLIEGKITRLDGSTVDVEAVAGPFVYQGQLGNQVVMRDITARKEAAKRITFLAQYDSLTGLPNRGFFRYRLAGAMVRANRSKQLLAVMFLDLDRFKDINDSLGHAAGDELLLAVARRLRSLLPEVDTIARLGGDEFTIMVEDLHDVDQVKALAERIQATLADPIHLQEREITVSASIGIAVYPFYGDGVEELLQAADVAMYRAKKNGRNTFEFYAPEMNALAVERLDMERCLRNALERGEFCLHFQPKVAARGGRIVGAEALIRWQSAELGLISPDRFIPLAEETGIIVPIGEWVLRTACAQAKAWQDQGLPPLSVAVNLSPRQFRHKELLQSIRTVLQETGLPAGLLELEITESMAMERPEEAIEVLRELNALGVRLSVDDFGTGFSSLATLQRFPVHKLKIDQSFVRGLTGEASDSAIVRAIVAVARSLDLGVVAEGVETFEQLTILVELGCDELQGFHLGRPVPAQEFVHLLRTMAALDVTRIQSAVDQEIAA